MNIDAKTTIINTLWSLVTRFSSLFIEFSVQIILARYFLLPEDVGAMAIIMIFIAFGRVFIHSGLGQALIQKESISEIEKTSIFYINLIIGLFLTILLFVLSKPISVFYNQPILIPILKVVSIYFILNSLVIVQDSILTRNLKFKVKFYINIISQILTSVITIYLGYIGLGIWVLVSHLLCAIFFRVLLLWIFSSWRPILAFDWEKSKSIFSFGIGILCASFTTVFRLNIIPIIVGKYSNISEIGYYKKANDIQNVSSKLFTTSIQNVLFPVFSKMQNDIKVLSSSLRKTISYLFFIITPVMLFLSINSEDIIILILTEKWILSSSYLKLVSILGILYPLQMMNLNVLKSIGKSNNFMISSISWDVLSILTIFYIAYTTNGNIESMIIGQIFITLICYIFNVYFNGTYYGYDLFNQIKDLTPLFIINFIFYMLMIVIPVSISTYLSIDILFKLFIGLCIYLSLTFFIKKELLSDIFYKTKSILGK